MDIPSMLSAGYAKSTSIIEINSVPLIKLLTTDDGYFTNYNLRPDLKNHW